MSHIPRLSVSRPQMTSSTPVYLPLLGGSVASGLVSTGAEGIVGSSEAAIFYHPICLGMVGSCIHFVESQEHFHFLHQSRQEGLASVTQDFHWNAMPTDNLLHKQLGNCGSGLTCHCKHFWPLGQIVDETTAYWFPSWECGNWITSTPIRSKGPATGIGVIGGFTAHPGLRVAHTKQPLHHLLTSLRIPGHQ